MFLAQDKVFMGWPSRIIFGCGERGALPPLLKKLGYRSALIVTDRFFTEKSTIVADLVAALHAVGIASRIFDGGLPDPSVALCVSAGEWVAESAAGRAPGRRGAGGGGGGGGRAEGRSGTGRD